MSDSRRRPTPAAITFALIAICSSSCKPHSPAPPPPSTTNGHRVSAAALFTSQYARSRMSAWDLQARAAGSDCTVLFVQTPMIMDSSVVEALHYGAGAYDVYDGGVQRFYRERSFRAVVYKDGSERLWTYGAITAGEAEGLESCH